MKLRTQWLIVVIVLLLVPIVCTAADSAVKEVTLSGPNDVTLKLRMEGPSTADVPLQVVCYFKYTPEGAKRMFGAPVELDKDLGGVIGALRERGEFQGNALETLLIKTPDNTIKAKALLLVGLGDEKNLSLELLQNVGMVAVREAGRIGADKVAFAPLIRDQGNSSFDAGDVEQAVIFGVMLAYDTDRRLQREGFAKPYSLKQWIVEAGPSFFDTTQIGVQKGIDNSKAVIGKRPSQPHATLQP